MLLCDVTRVAERVLHDTGGIQVFGALRNLFNFKYADIVSLVLILKRR